MTEWTVLMPLSVALVIADTAAEARQKVLVRAGFGHKPWLARDWVVRLSTPEDLALYAAMKE